MGDYCPHHDTTQEETTGQREFGQLQQARDQTCSSCDFNYSSNDSEPMWVPESLKIFHQVLLVGDLCSTDPQANEPECGLRTKDNDGGKIHSPTSDGFVAVRVAAMGTPDSRGIPTVVAATSSAQRSYSSRV